MSWWARHDRALARAISIGFAAFVIAVSCAVLELN